MSIDLIGKTIPVSEANSGTMVSSQPLNEHWGFSCSHDSKPREVGRGEGQEVRPLLKDEVGLLTMSLKQCKASCNICSAIDDLH